MATPEDKKTSSIGPCLVCRLIGLSFLGYSVYGAAKGEIVQRMQRKYEFVIRVSEQPWRFWIIVGALAFAGLVFTVVGFMPGISNDD